MKVLLQHTQTKQYLSWAGEWTTDANQALDFGGVVQALDYALAHFLRETRPVVQFDRANPELALAPVRWPRVEVVVSLAGEEVGACAPTLE